MSQATQHGISTYLPEKTRSGSAVRTALLAMGRQPAILKIVLGATVVFHITALTTIPLIGAMGANIAHVAMCAVWLIALNIVYHKALKDPPDAGLKPAPLEDAID